MPFVCKQTHFLKRSGPKIEILKGNYRLPWAFDAICFSLKFAYVLASSAEVLGVLSTRALAASVVGDLSPEHILTISHADLNAALAPATSPRAICT